MLFNGKRIVYGRWRDNDKTVHFYNLWSNMKRRCLDSNNISYKYYGGRGIKIYKPWLKFKNFMSDLWESYDNHVEVVGSNNRKYTTIERTDNNKGYFPDNVDWATMKQQCNNRRNSIRKK